jgi:large subunit ribosomal protein L31
MRTPVVLVCGQGNADGVAEVLAQEHGTVVVRHRFDGQVVVRSVGTRDDTSQWPLEVTDGCVACTVRDDLHPDYHPVVFQDAATGEAFLTRSTITSERTIDWTDGRTYPLVVVDVSSASHPFWTGSRRHIVTAGQAEKFRRRYG